MLGWEAKKVVTLGGFRKWVGRIVDKDREIDAMGNEGVTMAVWSSGSSSSWDGILLRSIFGEEDSVEREDDKADAMGGTGGSSSSSKCWISE